MAGTEYGRLERIAFQAESYVLVIDGEHINVGAVIRALYTDHRRLAREVAAQEAERAQILRREEEAWRQANLADAKVRGWEATLVVDGLPQRFVPVQGWGPGEAEAVSVPQITPERLTDILDRIAAQEAQIEGLEAEAAATDDLMAADSCRIAALETALAAERAKVAKLVGAWDLARSHSLVKVTLGDGDARKSWGDFLIAMDEARAAITEAGQ